MVLEEVCCEETYSWWHFSTEQIDPYWIVCLVEGPHDEHYDEHTGLRWKVKKEEHVAIHTNETTPATPDESWTAPDYPLLARKVVVDYFNTRAEKTDQFAIGVKHTYVVHFTYILGRWKALVSTTIPDGMYYEVTYDGAKDEIYVDAYKKFNNVAIPLSEFEQRCIRL